MTCMCYSWSLWKHTHTHITRTHITARDTDTLLLLHPLQMSSQICILKQFSARKTGWERDLQVWRAAAWIQETLQNFMCLFLCVCVCVKSHFDLKSPSKKTHIWEEEQTLIFRSHPIWRWKRTGEKWRGISTRLQWGLESSCQILKWVKVK